MRTLLGTAVLVLLVSACGGEPSAETQATSTPSAKPQAVEPQPCRSAIVDANDVAQGLATQATSAADFTRQFKRLQELVDQADGPCRTATVQPMSEAAYHFSLAAAYKTICENGGTCQDAKTAKEVVRGGELAQKAVTAANRTR